MGVDADVGPGQAAAVDDGAWLRASLRMRTPAPRTWSARPGWFDSRWGRAGRRRGSGSGVRGRSRGSGGRAGRRPPGGRHPLPTPARGRAASAAALGGGRGGSPGPGSRWRRSVVGRGAPSSGRRTARHWPAAATRRHSSSAQSAQVHGDRSPGQDVDDALHLGLGDGERGHEHDSLAQRPQQDTGPGGGGAHPPARRRRRPATSTPPISPHRRMSTTPSRGRTRSSSRRRSWSDRAATLSSTRRSSSRRRWRRATAAARALPP